METTGYKLMDLRTGAVTTKRSGNVHFHEKFTVARDYVRRLLLNTYQNGVHELTAEIPITSTLEDGLFPEAGQALTIPVATKTANLSAEKELLVVSEPVGGGTIPPAVSEIQQPAAVRRMQMKRKRRRRSSSSSCDDSGGEFQQSNELTTPVPARTASPRRK
ncbi:hypothetical protein PC123_g3854 [Phytophthora cactorum]|nr:hypothetical protein PC123_g3854 [Phytophthora cactorum]